MVRFQLQERLLRQVDDLTAGAVSPVSHPRLMTFSSLENALTAELTPPEIDDLRRRFIINRLAVPLARFLQPEAAPIEGEILRGLADDLGDGFDRLRLAGLTWSQVAGLRPGPLAGLLAGLGREYDRLLAERGCSDRFAKRRLVLEALQDGHAFQTLAAVETIVCRWSQRLSPFETDLLLALTRGRQVQLTLKIPAWARDENIDHGSGFNLLRTIRQIEACPAPTLWLDFAAGQIESPAIPPALAYAAETLLAPPAYRRADPPDPAGRLAVLRTATAYQEAEEAARRLKQLIINGDHPHDLALVAPDLTRYGPLIDDVGRRFGLPFHFRRGETLADQGPVRAVLRLVALWSSHWERSRLLDLIQTPYFGAFQDLAQTDLHRLTLAAGVTDRRAGGGFRENLTKYSARGEGTRIVARLMEIVKKLETAGAALAAAPDWADFFFQFKRLLNDLEWPGDLGAAPEEPLNLHGADLAAALAFKEELERLALAMTDPQAPPVGLQSFQLWFKTVLSERHLTYDHNPGGRVWVLNYHDLHGGEFQEIFFLGLNERLFPQTGPETRWWPEEFTRSAAAADILGRPLWNEAADRYRQEELMLATGLGQARRRVWLMYHAGDETGRLALPSPLLKNLTELWPDGAGGSLLPWETVAWNTTPPLGLAAGPDEMWAGLAADRPENWPSVCRTPERLAVWHELRQRRGQWRNQRRQAALRPETLSRWLANLERHQGRPLVNPSFLAAFQECPLRFWWAEALRLPAAGEPLEEWAAVSEGTLIHSVLEQFFRRRLGPGSQPGPPWPGSADFASCQVELLTILEQETQRHAAKTPLGRQPLWRLRRDRLSAFLSGWLRRELTVKTVRPWRVEWSFGPAPEDASPPWELPLDADESIFLKGRADRVDQTEQGLAVRDYKLRDRPHFRIKPPHVPARAWPLLTYALAASAALGRPAESFFEILDPHSPAARRPGLPTDSPFMAVAPAERAAVTAAGEFNLPQTLAETWRRLGIGHFAPEGDPESVCPYCPYTVMCPRAEGGEEGL